MKKKYMRVYDAIVSSNACMPNRTPFAKYRLRVYNRIHCMITHEHIAPIAKTCSLLKKKPNYCNDIFYCMIKIQ